MADAPGAQGLPSLRRVALRGSAIVIGAYGGREFIRLAANLIVSRLLSPEAYGLMAIVNTLIGGLQMFSDVGLNFSVIHSKRGSEPAFLGTVWSVEIIRGVVLCVIATVAAPAVAAFYGAPALTSLLAVASISTVLTGLRSVSMLHRQRTLRQGWLAAVEIGSMALASLTMVIWAWLDASVWALVAGGLVGSAAQVVISHAAPTDVRVSPGWDRSAIREISTFGKWVFVSTLMLYLAQQSDRLIFGRIGPLALLGVYNVATVFVSPPATIMNRLGDSIAFPALARAHGATRDFRDAYTRLRGPLVLMGGVLVSLLIASGPALIELLYDPRWHEAGWFLRWLALQAWFRVLATAPAAALLSMGLSRLDAFANMTKALAIPVGVSVGFALGGFHGAVVGFALSEIFRWGFYAAACHYYKLPGIWADLGITLQVLAFAGLGVAAGAVAAEAGAHALVSLAASSLTAAIGWLPSLWRLYLTELRGGPSALSGA